VAQVLQLPQAASAASQVGATSHTQAAPQAVETAAEEPDKVVAEAPSVWVPRELEPAAWQEPEEARRTALASPAQDDRQPEAVRLEAAQQQHLVETRLRRHWEARTYACIRPARAAVGQRAELALPGAVAQRQAVAPGIAGRAW